MYKYTVAFILLCVSIVSLSAYSSQTASSVPDNNIPDLIQWVLNALFVLVGSLGGWILNNLQKSLRELQKTDSILADKVHAIDVLVAGHYVSKPEFDKLGDALFTKLDRIESKLDSKVDK